MTQTQSVMSMVIMEANIHLIVFLMSMVLTEVSIVLQVLGTNILLAMMFPKQLMVRVTFMDILLSTNTENISDDLEDIYESANGDLEVVREILCDALS